MKIQIDPLSEKKHEVLPGLVWKYENRTLFLVTDKCHSNCPFCFRKNIHQNFSLASFEEVSNFIKKKREIREFIFSGGEPLLCTQKILKISHKLSTIKHLKIFRIHTRLPIVKPSQVNFSILRRLTEINNNPWYLVIHVNNHEELKRDTVKCLEKLRKMGFILLSHTVFLKGTNDSVKELDKLFSRLIEVGVKPYYIFHCDYMKHTKKFIVPIEKEIKIMTELRKRLSGLAYPLHVIDSFTGNGKVPVPTGFWQCNLASYKDFKGGKNNF